LPYISKDTPILAFPVLKIYNRQCNRHAIHTKRPLKKRCRILPTGGLGVYGHHPAKEVIIRLDRMIQMGCPPALKVP
jgi:hypothetical protein